MTEREDAVLMTELRLHGVHPTWIPWAMKKGMARFMLETLEGRTGFASLIPCWKAPLLKVDTVGDGSS